MWTVGEVNEEASKAPGNQIVKEAKDKSCASDEMKALFRKTVDHNLRRIEERLTAGALPRKTTTTKAPILKPANPILATPRRPQDVKCENRAKRDSPQVKWDTPISDAPMSSTPTRRMESLTQSTVAFSSPRWSSKESRGLLVGPTAPVRTLVVVCPCDHTPRQKVMVCHHVTPSCNSDYSVCTECEPSLVNSDCSCYRNPPRLAPYRQQYLSTPRLDSNAARGRTHSPLKAYIDGICRRLSPSMSKNFQGNTGHIKGILLDTRHPVLQQPCGSARGRDERDSSVRKLTDTSSVSSSMWRALMCGTCFEMAGDEDGRSSVNSESDDDGDDGSDGGGDGDDGAADADQGDSASEIEAIEYSSDGGGSSGASSVSNDGSVYQDELMNEMYHHDLGYDDEQDELDYLYRDHNYCHDEMYDGYSYADEEERIRGYCDGYGIHDPLNDLLAGRRIECQSGSEECGERCDFYADEYL